MRARLHSSPRPDVITHSGVAVTQVSLTRSNVILIARLSAATRLPPGRYRPRIALVRLFLRETIEAAIEPSAELTANALTARLSAHFDRLRRTPDHPLTELARHLVQRAQPGVACLPAAAGHGTARMRAAAPCEPTTLRLPTSELVAIDNYRCDIRQASGQCISRSALLRAAIDSFARAFQIST